MPTNVIMPQLGESVFEGTLSKWLKQEGEAVKEFDPLVEVNTDKVDTEIPAPASGVLLKRLVTEGTVVKVGTVLAVIGQAGEAVSAGGAAGAIPSAAPARAAATPAAPSPAVAAALPTGRGDLGFISPVVAKMAEENQIDLRQVRGTGQGGRITKQDVLAYLAAPKSAGAAPAPAPLPARAPAAEIKPGDVLPVVGMRKSIAEHMVLSERTAPHVTTVFEVDMSKAAAHREANKAMFARDGVNLTYTAYFVAAAAAGLKAVPLVNSQWADDKILLKRECHIGVAVALDEGLIVPVIKNAEDKSLLRLAREVNDLAQRARGKALKPDEVTGGTFTITNHGVSGSLFATPIISQPQTGILGVGQLQKRAVVINDAIAIRPMVYLSLTFDHRVLDGAVADHFLAAVKQTLENWA
jgi:2-oxoglutarate dehydrogenase E2 component (dihydrolipoamide succinyltransferase)